MQSPLQLWRRRWWRPDRQALAAYAGLRPMVVVTGGSEGIGYALARRFAAAGNDVMLVARRPEPLEAGRRPHPRRVQGRGHRRCRPTSPRRTPSPPSRRRWRHTGAYADVLVNSAGMGLAGPFHEPAAGEVMQLIDLNVRRADPLTRHFLTGMRVRGRGGILNLASLGGYAPGPNQACLLRQQGLRALPERSHRRGDGRARACASARWRRGRSTPRFHARMGAERAFYRYLVPPASAESVARAGYRGFALGLRVDVPGLVNPFLALAMRIMPHRIVIPIVASVAEAARGSADDARQPDLRTAPSRRRRPGAAPRKPRRTAKKPVCIVLHQENSNPGHVGQWFVRNGYNSTSASRASAIRCPQTLENHCGAVIFGGPMSANDKDEFICAETEWIGVALKEEKPFLGICLGAQMLANHLGAKVGFHPEELAEIGYYPLVTTAEGAPPSGRSPIMSISGTAKASSWRAVRGCSPRPPAPTPIRPSATARPSACSSTPRSPTPRCIAGPATISARLGMKGARERHEHIQGHIDHGAQGARLARPLPVPLGQVRAHDRLAGNRREARRWALPRLLRRRFANDRLRQGPENPDIVRWASCIAVVVG